LAVNRNVLRAVLKLSMDGRTNCSDSDGDHTINLEHAGMHCMHYFFRTRPLVLQQQLVFLCC